MQPAQPAQPASSNISMFLNGQRLDLERKEDKIILHEERPRRYRCVSLNNSTYLFRELTAADGHALHKIYQKVIGSHPPKKPLIHINYSALDIQAWMHTHRSELANITHLDLSGLGLEVVPAELAFFTGLTCLSLKNNQLSGITWKIDQLAKLEILDLSNNHLFLLPKELQELTSLKAINLSHNHFQQFPDALLNVCSLEAIRLDNNYLEEIPETIDRLAKLEVFILRKNFLKFLPGTLNVHLIKHLDFSENPPLSKLAENSRCTLIKPMPIKAAKPSVPKT